MAENQPAGKRERTGRYLLRNRPSPPFYNNIHARGVVGAGGGGKSSQDPKAQEPGRGGVMLQ